MQEQLFFCFPDIIAPVSAEENKQTNKLDVNSRAVGKNDDCDSWRGKDFLT